MTGLTVAAGALVLAAVLAAVSAGTHPPALRVPVLTLVRVVDWFRERSESVRSVPSRLAVSVLESAEPGHIVYVVGIFDKDLEEFVDAARLEAGELEPTLAAQHTTHQVAVWT